MPTRARPILILGSGPGIGNHIAAQFLSKGFTHAILLSRNTTRLQSDVAFVQSHASTPTARVSSLQLDLSNLSSIPSVLEKIDALLDGQAPEVILFNAARISPSPALAVPVSEIEEDFRVTTLSLYLVAQHYLPKLAAGSTSFPPYKPALLVTNSHLPREPNPELLSLSLNKAAQRNLVLSLAKAFVNTNVHLGLISVEGTVAPENEHLNPKNIAEKTWEFYEQGKGSGTEMRILE
jgi:NAD(P)-dependent dehydrogenase (short-subunit alcohol dehydrogenase family)